MKITLKNFRCYENSSFDFGDQGLTLLSGPSGAGKTSIMLGIYFALFGTGTKLAMYGKTSCSVKLEFTSGFAGGPSMVITRTKRPNRVVVQTDGNEYEDEAAQSIINNTFGNSFKTTGYISQNARDSFILMSPIEKLAFLEKFAFQDINLLQIKKRCKDLIKERNETLLKTNAQLEMATAMIEEMEKPENIDFAAFTQKVGAVIGAFELVPCTATNGLIHPYQSADVIVNGKVCGFISKLHPTVQEYFDIPVTFIAELDFDTFLPKHINATPISKFQGVYKDLSVVIDKSLNYFEVAKVLNALALPTLKDSYPVDIYEDEKLGDKKSLTVRFFIQSMEKTLEDADIEGVMSEIMSALASECKAELR